MSGYAWGSPPEVTTLRAVRSCAGSFGAAALNPFEGSHTDGPAKPVPWCALAEALGVRCAACGGQLK